MIQPIGCYKNKQGEISPSFSFEMMEIFLLWRRLQKIVSGCKNPSGTFKSDDKQSTTDDDILDADGANHGADNMEGSFVIYPYQEYKSREMQII